jgi:hypothetical protein
MDAHDHQVGEPEGNVALGEGPRDGQGQDQEPGHPAEQQQPPGRPVRRDGVGQPGVAAVHVEDHAEHQHHPQQPPRGRVVAQHGGELGDGEHEDQVEEELKGGDALEPLGLLGRLGQLRPLARPGAARR